MKTSRKLLSSVIIFTMGSHLVQAASDISISNQANSDVTASTPFRDSTDNGGASNLQVVSLVGALGTSDVTVTTTSAGVNPLEGKLQVKDSIAWNTNRKLSLSADANIVIGATITSLGGGGSLNLNAGTTVAFNVDVTLIGAQANLSVTSGGISQTPGRKLLIDGQADLSGGAGAVTVLSDNRFGSLKLQGGAVTVNEADSTLLTGVGVNTLTLTTVGTITDGAGTIINVTDLANLNAGANAITLGDNAGDVTNFGSLNLTGTAVGITEDSSSELAAVSATSFALTSSGAITDTGNIGVSGLATFKAGLNDITLGDNPGETTNFGTLNITGGAVSISEDSASVLTGVGASSLTLDSKGTITDANGTSLVVTGLATFNAGSNGVTLGDSAGDNTRFGSLSVTGSTVNIIEDDATALAGMSAGILNLDSAGAITNTAGAVIGVSGLATLKGTSILLGGIGSSTIFGSLKFNSAGSVSLQLDSAATISGANTASTVVLDTTGTSIFAAGATLNATSLTIQGGGLDLSGNNLVDSMGLTLAGSASLNMGALNETVATFTSNNGTLAGTGTLTAATYTLNGGTMNANLGGGILNHLSNATALNGTSLAATVNVSGGTLTLGAADRLNDAAVVSVSGATLDTGIFADRVGTFTLTNGTLAGSGTLTAATYALNGGTVDANLGGGVLNQKSGSTTLNGTSAAATVNLTGGSLLLGAQDRLNDAAAVTVTAATLDMGTFNDTVGTFSLNPAGVLAGNGTLTATGGATLNGATVSGNLLANTTSTGPVLISGTVGGGSLALTGGSVTLTGTSSNTTVTISPNARLLNFSGGLDVAAIVTNAGLLTVLTSDSISTYTQNGVGELAGGASLTATQATLNGGKISGSLLGNTTSTGKVLVSGKMGGGSLSVTGGTLTLKGTSSNSQVDISAGAQLLDNNGALSATAKVSNAGQLTLNSADTVLTYTQNKNGILAGSSLTTTDGATLNGGQIAGRLFGNTTSTGKVLVSGKLGGGVVQVSGGTLTLNGTVDSNTLVNAGATLKGTGLIKGNLDNRGTLAVGTKGGKLTILGDLVTRGTVALNLKSSKQFEQIVAGTVDLGGKLVIKNTGSGLASGQRVSLFDAGSLSNGIKLKSFITIGFDNGLLFNNHTGTLIGLAGAKSIVSGAYLNLSPNQTKTFLALYDDSVQAGTQNVTRLKHLSGTGEDLRFVSGESSGDSRLVDTLNQVTFATPGSIDAATINSLSPEVHRGMADFTEQALRAQVRQAVDSAPVSQKGKTQVYATLHMTSDGVDGTGTNAGYDIDIQGATTGLRHDFNENLMVGGFLGIDSGDIDGALIDTDAQGFVVGSFATYHFGDACKTMITGSAAFGNYSYDATRRSFGGDVSDDSIGSDAVELSLGVSSMIYEGHGLRVAPSAALRYIGGNVDRFVEKGAGIPLAVESQDIETLLVDVGIDLNYQVMERLSLAGRVGYQDHLSSSDESVTATFAATGPAGVPFTVGAPGIDNQAVTLNLGLFYDITENARVGATYRVEFRTDSQTSQTFGMGLSYGF